ncbi:MAG: hypothetical protein OXL37_02155 [Chloroflexota bacterium]|nr:hypothetical protein [Chloroflexota bacterium]MDE2961470.1 hypothetical protein [Chloroflexota bacterium]
MKRWLALRRWWIAGVTAGLVAFRILIAIGIEALGIAGGSGPPVMPALTAALDALALGLAVVAVVAFVQYGRLFNARVPTE